MNFGNSEALVIKIEGRKYILYSYSSRFTCLIQPHSKYIYVYTYI